MKCSGLINIGFLLLTLFGSACTSAKRAKNNNFLRFLSAEMAALGAKPNSLGEQGKLSGQWSVRRDEFGAAIDTEGIEFKAITNALTSAFGPPRFYTKSNQRHGPTYLYAPSQVGIAVFVSSTKHGAEVTLTTWTGKQGG